MRPKALAIIATIVILIGIGLYYGLRNNDIDGLPGNENSTTTSTVNGGTPSNNDNNTDKPGGITQNSMIRVTSPAPNAVVTSPIAIRGEARGNWFFEASFPVKLLDANGKELAVIPATAQGEWMTTEFVPFSASLSYPTPTTNTGVLVFEKDNPSGLPQNAAEIRIPVKFGQVSTSTRVIKLYYYNESKDKDATGNVQCTSRGLESVDRTISLTNTPIQDALRLLLRGELSAAERTKGISTEFPLSGVELRSASLQGGVLTIGLNDPQNRTSGGSCRVAILRAQVEATAKQFPGVNSVRFTPSTLFQP